MLVEMHLLLSQIQRRGGGTFGLPFFSFGFLSQLFWRLDNLLSDHTNKSYQSHYTFKGIVYLLIWLYYGNSLVLAIHWCKGFQRIERNVSRKFSFVFRKMIEANFCISQKFVKLYSQNFVFIHLSLKLSI